MINFGLLAIILLGAGDSKAAETVVFQLDAPQNLERSLPKGSLAPPSSHPLLASIEGPIPVKVAKGRHAVKLQAGLITLIEPITGRCSFGVSAEPMKLVEAKQAASQLLELLEVDTGTLDEWAANAACGDDAKYAKRTVGKRQTVSLEIRRSFRDDLPWTITFTVSYDRRD